MTASFILPLFGLFVMIFVFVKVSRNQFSVEQSFFWISLSLGIMLLSVFPRVVDRLASLMGVYYPPAVLFLVSTIILLLLHLRSESKITNLEQKIKTLAQYTAIIEERLRRKPEEKVDNEQF